MLYLFEIYMIVVTLVFILALGVSLILYLSAISEFHHPAVSCDPPSRREASDLIPNAVVAKASPVPLPSARKRSLRPAVTDRALYGGR